MTQQERDEIKALVLSFSTRISDLPEVEALQDDDYITVVQNDGSKKHSKKATLMALLELIKVYYPDNNGAKFQGIAHPTDSNVKLPVGTDGFWFAIDLGVYVNYGGIVVGNSPKVIYYNVVTGEWSSDNLWGEIGGAIKVKLVEGDGSVTTNSIPVTSSATYTFGNDIVPSGSVGVGVLTEYDKNGNILHTESLDTNPKTITTQSGSVYAKIVYPTQQGNPPVLENSSVTVSSTLRILVEALYNYVTDILISKYDSEFLRLGNELASLIIDKDRIAAQVQDLEGNMALLEITASQILARVSNAEGDIAQLYIRADEIGTRVENAEGDISTLVQRADSITATVQNAQGDIAQLQITAQAITSTVRNMQGDISEIRQTATSITARVQDAENNIASLEITSRAITSRVSDAEGNITQLQQTSTTISARLADAEGNLNTLELTALGLASRITDTEGNINTLTITASLLESQIQDAQGNISTLTQTAEQISMRVQSTEVGVAALSIRADEISASVESLNGDVASLTITSQQIQSVVESHTGEISSITQRADEIELRVADTEGNVSTLTQTASSLTSQIQDINGNMSVLEQTAQSLTSRISTAEGNISTIEQTAYGISTRVEDLAGNVSTLSQTVDGFEAQVRDVEGNISTLTQTAESLTSRITNTEGNVSILQQTATELSSAISDAQGNISTLNQTVDGFELRVISMEGDMSSIHQDVSNIELRVQTTEGNLSSLSLDVDRINAQVSQINSDLGEYEEFVNGVLGDLQDQIDGAIDTWFYNGTPTLNNLPASEWTTTAEKDMHLGDVYYDNETGYAYRFTKVNNTYSWVEITDSAVVDALRRANNAQDTADHKRRVFVYSQQYPTPYAPYDPGDLWVKPIQVTVPNQQQPVNTTVLYRCVVGREKVNNTFPFNPSIDLANDWEPADGQALTVSNANIEILYNSITNTVNSYTYNADGTLSTTTQNMIRQTAEDTILTITGDELETVGIFIHNANPADNYIVLQSDVVKIKGTGDHTPTGLAIIWDAAAQRYKIDVDSLNVLGIFSTQAWTDERLSLYNDATDYTDTEVNSAKSYLINTVIPGVVSDINDDYGYLKDALNEDTVIAGGLILTNIIELGGVVDGQYKLMSGISGQYRPGEHGYGLAAWFGGPKYDYLDWKLLPTSEQQTTDYAKSAFRMDGSGYLAGGAITWGRVGDVHLLDNVYIGSGTDQGLVDTITSISTFVTKLSTWFYDSFENVPGLGYRHVLRINMNGTAAEGTDFAGVAWDGFLITGGDQIVISGTPMSGGGGGGASNLYNLLDVYGHESDVVKRADGTNVSNGDILSYDTTLSKWVALSQSSISPDLSNFYTKSQTNTAISSAISALNLGSAATRNVGSVASGNTGLVTGGDVWTAIDNLPEPMVFKGSLGTGGTITALPTNGSAKIGDTYKVITAGTYAGKTAKVGDTFICNGKTSSSNTWELIPSGDEPDGTVTSVGLTVPTGLSVSGSPITTSGTFAITFASGYSIPTTANQTAWTNKYDKPSGGIPASDLATTVQTNITNGATAYGYFSSGILPVSHGGTGRDTLTSGSALIGNGTNQVSLRAITNNTTATAVTASTNLITANTLYYHKGNANIVTVGTISSGVWQGTPIANEYIANSSITIGSTTYNLGDTKTVLEGLTKVALTNAGELIVGGAKITWVAASGSTPGYLKIDKALVTEGDQIVISGTPGSGGGGTGGASNLYNLLDIYGHESEVVKRADGSSRTNGDLLSFNSTLGKWVALDQSAVSPDMSGYYTSAQTNTAISSAINALNLGDAATYNVGSVASGNTGLVTGGAVWSAIDALPEPMIFKGSLGTNGTIQSLPTASSANEGFTYKVITAGTYASQSAKIGDLFISNGSSWVWVPSGDEPSGTVTSVGVSVPTGFSVSNTPITTSGTIAISFASGYSLPTTANQTAWSAKYDKPSGGIPKSDLASAVQTSLGLADSALQSHQTIYQLVIKNSAGTAQITYKPATSGTYELTLTKAMVGLGNVDNLAASGYFTALTNSGNDISITVGGTNKTLTVGYATKATQDGDGANIASTYVKKAGDTMTGILTLNHTYAKHSRIKFVDTRATASAGGWADNTITWHIADDTSKASIGWYGNGETPEFIYFGFADYYGKNLRIYPDGTLALGNGTNSSTASQKYDIYHQGNLTKSVLTDRLESDSGYYVKKSGDTMSGALTVNSNLSATGTVTLGSESSCVLYLNRKNNPSYIWAANTGGYLAFGVADKGSTSIANSTLVVNAYGIGVGGGTTANSTAALNVTGNAVVSGSVKIGSATISWNSNGYLHIDKPLVTNGDQIVISGTPGEGGGGGGATTLSGLDDVTLTSVSNGQILQYNGTKWVNVAASTVGGVTSVVGQTGAITTAQIATALTGAGYKLTDTTYGLVTTSSNGLALAYSSANRATSTSGTTYYLLGWNGTGSSATLKWYSLPANAFNNTTYSNGTGISLSGTTFSLDVAGAKTALGLGSNAYTSTAYLPLAGGTMTGVLNMKANMYEDAYNGALNMSNSDIYALNSIYTADLSNSQAEGIHFYRTETTVDTFRASNGVLYFAPNRTLGGTATEYTIIHSGNYTSYVNTTNFPGLNATVSSITLTQGTGISITNSGTAITTSGTRTISINSTYQTYITNGNTAHGWGNHASAGYVKLNPGAAEQTLQSSISSLSKGVINLWRSSGDHYTFLGFSNGTTETYLGGIGFKSQSDTNLYHRIPGGTVYKIWDENNLTKSVITNLIGTTTYAAYNANGYLPLNGGTLTGVLELSHTYANNARIKYTETRATASGGGWADSILDVYNAAGTWMSSIGIAGNNDTLNYLYIGVNDYNGTNLRFGSDSTLKWGTDTIWHAGNDGSGSGLDADLLDGLHSSSFFVSNGNRGAIDFNTDYLTGYEYVSGSATNGGTVYAILFTATYGDAGMQVNFGRNTAMSYRNRTSNSQWSSWRTVYDTANSNKSDVAWACSTLTATTAITRCIEFSNVASSAGNGGYIDFHYNGSTADYTSRIIENASGKLLVYGDLGVGTTPSFKLDVAGQSAAYGFTTKYDLQTKMSSAGWYTVFTALNTNATSQTVILQIRRNYTNSNNETYTVSVNVAYNGKVSFTQISGCANTQLIDKIRVDYVNSGTTTIAIHYTGTVANTVFVSGIGDGTFCAPTAVSSVNGTAVEFKLQTSGMSTNAGITMANDNALGAYDTGGTRRTLLSLDGSNGIYLAWGAAAAGYNSYISGNNISFLYGTGHSNGMYLNSSGNVGIGTTSPTRNLDVVGVIQAGDATYKAVLEARPDGGGLSFWSDTTSSWHKGYIDASALIINTKNTGNVGIGTTSPGYKLDVKGVVQIKGASSEYGLRIANSGNTIDGLNGSSWGNLYINYSSSGNVYLCYGGGNVGVGTNSPSQKLHVSGNILATGAITAGAASDARLKKNIQSMTSDEAKKIVLALNPVTFTWNDKATELYDQYKGDDLGFVAQEVESVLPVAIGTIFDKYKRLDQTKFIAPLVAVAKDHESRIKELEARVKELEEENKRLRMN